MFANVQPNRGQEKLALRVEEVAELLSISDRHVWVLVRQGKFPKPIRLGGSTRWLRDDVVAYCRAQSTNNR